MASQKKIFVAPVLGVTFYVKNVDENGKVIEIRDDKTKKIIGYSEEKYQFTLADNRFAKGYKSVFICDENTDKNIVAELEKLAKDPSSCITTEREWIKRTEPKRAEVEDKLDEANAKLASNAKEIEAMKAELEKYKQQRNQGR